MQVTWAPLSKVKGRCLGEMVGMGGVEWRAVAFAVLTLALWREGKTLTLVAGWEGEDGQGVAK